MVNPNLPSHLIFSSHGSYKESDDNVTVPVGVEICCYVDKGDLCTIPRAWEVWQGLCDDTTVPGPIHVFSAGSQIENIIFQQEDWRFQTGLWKQGGNQNRNADVSFDAVVHGGNNIKSLINKLTNDGWKMANLNPIGKNTPVILHLCCCRVKQ